MNDAANAVKESDTSADPKTNGLPWVSSRHFLIFDNAMLEMIRSLNSKQIEKFQVDNKLVRDQYESLNSKSKHKIAPIYL